MIISSAPASAQSTLHSTGVNQTSLTHESSTHHLLHTDGDWWFN